MRNPKVLLMWVAIIALSAVLALRVQSALDERSDAQAQQRAADEGLANRRDQAPGDKESAPITLADRHYDRGDCVTWEQEGGLVETDVVNCSEPHLVEVIESVETDQRADAAYPTSEGWDELTAELCRPIVVEYLRGALDPVGRLQAGAILPTEDAWRSGARNMWCGVQSVTITPSGEPIGERTVIEGRAADVDQSLLFPVGSCLRDPDIGAIVVLCTEPHHVIVSGHVDLSELTGRASDEELRARCSEFASEVTTIVDGVPWFIGLNADSWAAGSRKGNCIQGVWDQSGKPVLQPAHSNA